MTVLLMVVMLVMGLFVIIVVVLGVHCNIYQSSYIITQLDLPPPPIILLYPLSPYSQNSSIGLIFPFSYMST
jgi:hypothetical protein